ncbi:helix-turn-helix domain-containing protein [uncultured Hymenobacter sp.]|uniref:helix-turn-helix domain-containing protein n=1 Tax=uncultured Hymenobacter sp. TaxID=170016 RepID=UPI0035C9F223
MLEKTLGLTIEYYRDKSGLTQHELAELSHVSARTIRELEAGRSNIGIQPLGRLLQALGLTLQIQPAR